MRVRGRNGWEDYEWEMEWNRNRLRKDTRNVAESMGDSKNLKLKITSIFFSFNIPHDDERKCSQFMSIGKV